MYYITLFSKNILTTRWFEHDIIYTFCSIQIILDSEELMSVGAMRPIYYFYNMTFYIVLEKLFTSSKSTEKVSLDNVIYR